MTDPSQSERIEELARAILNADASLGDDGLYEIVNEYDDAGQVISDEAIRVDDHMLALRAYDRAVTLALRGNA